MKFSKLFKYVPIFWLLPIATCSEEFADRPSYPINSVLRNETDNAIYYISFRGNNYSQGNLEYALRSMYDRASKIEAYSQDTVKTEVQEGLEEIDSIYLMVISSKTMESYPKPVICGSFMVDTCYKIPVKEAVASTQTIVFDGAPHRGNSIKSS